MENPFKFGRKSDDENKVEKPENVVMEIIYTEGEGGNEVKREKIEWGDEKPSTTYEEALKFAKEHGKEWRLPTYAEIEYARSHNLSGLNPVGYYWIDSSDWSKGEVPPKKIEPRDADRFFMEDGKFGIDTWTELGIAKIVKKVE